VIEMEEFEVKDKTGRKWIITIGKINCYARPKM